MKDKMEDIEYIINTKLILNYIKLNNLTKREFCKQCDINESTFYRIMKQKNTYIMPLVKIAKKINVKVRELLLVQKNN